jgi:hypothetical protein
MAFDHDWVMKNTSKLDQMEARSRRSCCCFPFHHTLQKFVILPKEKTTVWVKQNVNFFQQNGSVIKLEQN